MEHANNQGKLFLNRFLEPKAIIFGFAVLHCIAVLMYVMRYQREFPIVSAHWNPVRVMYEPVLLLLAAAMLLPDKLWGYLIAIVTAGRVIYVVGYLGLFATSAAHDRPMLSWYVMRTWFVLTYESQPQYFVEILLAGAIVGYTIIRCSRRFLSRGNAATQH